MGELQKRITDKLHFQNSLEPAYPKSMLVEVTNSCNHKCRFCENRVMTRKISHIDENFFCRVLQEAYDLGTRELGFSMVGEPLLAKNLDKYICTAKNIGYEYVYITTNGSLATPVRMEALIKAGLDSIKFSINAGSPKTYEYIHGKPDFVKTISNLKYLAEYRNKTNIPLKLFVSFIVTKLTEEECRDFEYEIRPLVDDVEFYKLNFLSSVGKEYDELRPDNHQPQIKSRPCPIVFNRFHITSEGYLNACCHDFNNFLAIADLNVVSLKEAWNSQSFKSLRQRHLDNRLEDTLCHSCLSQKKSEIKPLNPEHVNI